VFSIEHLHTLRTAEIDKIVTFFRPGALVLEVGAGTGHQALDLSERGINITAIEIPDSNYAQARVFSIIDYDGHHIPFDDASFDIVFSSNVMEHICDHQTNREIQRVLRSDGYCVHVIPTHIWRFWTTLSAFPTAFQYAGSLKSQLLPHGIPKRDVVNRKLRLLRLIAYALIDVSRENQEVGRRLVAGRPPPGGAVLPTSTRRTRQHHFRTLAVSPNVVAARISRRWVRAHQRRADGIILHGTHDLWVRPPPRAAGKTREGAR
jgi:SAM-dependent methyltransferase